jgi:hypothetical protein
VVNNKSISKTAVNGMIQPETALTGKDSSLDTCLLDLSSKLKHQRVCMVSSIQADRNQRYLQMCLNLTSVQPRYKETNETQEYILKC